MKNKLVILCLPLFVVLVLLVSVEARAEPINVIVNGWALGIDTNGCPGDIDSGWQHNDQMSLSRCYKNPFPPDGLSSGGAAFKCGPVQGQCSPNVLGESWQDFNVQDRGVSLSESYNVTYQHLQICVGCDFVHVDLLGSTDGQNWNDLGRLIDYPQTAVCNALTLWPTYCGSLPNVPHYEFYRLYVTGQYSQQLGYKFTGVELYFEPVDELPTATPSPTAQPTETPVIYLPLVLGSGNYELQCAGELIINEPYVICTDN